MTDVAEAAPDRCAAQRLTRFLRCAAHWRLRYGSLIPRRWNELAIAGMGCEARSRICRADKLGIDARRSEIAILDPVRQRDAPSGCVA